MSKRTILPSLMIFWWNGEKLLHNYWFYCFSYRSRGVTSRQKTAKTAIIRSFLKVFDLKSRLDTLHTIVGRARLHTKKNLAVGHARARFGGWWVVDPPLQGLSLSIGSGARPLMVWVSMFWYSIEYQWGGCWTAAILWLAWACPSQKNMHGGRSTIPTTTCKVSTSYLKSKVF